MGIVPDVGAVPGSDLKAAGDPLYLVGTPEPAFGGSVYADLFGPPPGADPGAPAASLDAPAAYRALYRAIAAGLARACHDLSDGGLAAALAEMCIGGRLGARITAPGDGSAAAALFGETNGCLVVEVDAASASEFERAMAGVACRRIGETDDGGRLEMSAGGAGFVVTLDDMTAAYGGTRSER